MVDLIVSNFVRAVSTSVLQANALVTFHSFIDILHTQLFMSGAQVSDGYLCSFHHHSGAFYHPRKKH